MKTPVATEFQVYCAHTDLMDPKSLKAHPENPNEHPEKQIDLFLTILKFNGWRRAITVSRRSGFVTKGHGALLAALAAGSSLVPVDYQEYETEAQELADIVADNKLQGWSTLNEEKLETLLVKLDTGEIDLEVTGFDKNSLERMFQEFSATPDPELNVGEAGLEGASEPLAGEQSPAAPVQPPASHVRMVQLFLNEDNIGEFMQMADFFQNRLSTSNVTETILEVLRDAYKHTGAT